MINANISYTSGSPSVQRNFAAPTRANNNGGIEVFPASQTPIDSFELAAPFGHQYDLGTLMRRTRALNEVDGTPVTRPSYLGQAAGEAVDRWCDQQTGSQAIVKFTEGAGRAAGRMIGESEGSKIFPILAPTIGGWIGASRGAEVGRNLGQFLARTPLSGFVGDKLRDMQGLGS